MATHFIAVLGTSLYQPTYYDTKDNLDQFVQAAVIRKFKEELSADGGLVTILLTRKARKVNWEDRTCGETDMTQSSRWDEELRLKEGDVKRGLRYVLESEFREIKVEAIDIPDGNDAEEIMKIFEVIYNSIKDEEDIIFDVTHGFRSIPILAMSVLNYAKTLKKCKLKGIFYGAFEAKKDDIVPIIDLTVYDEIMSWSFAANQFVKYGNARPIIEVYSELDKSRREEDIGDMVSIVTKLSDAINTSRGSSTGGKNANTKNAKTRSIKLAYQELEGLVKNGIQIKEIPPLEKLIIYVNEKYKCLGANSKNYQIGMAVVQLCIEFDMINQGFTALEETLKTFLCEMCSMDDTNKEDRERADLFLRSLSSYMSVKSKKGFKDYFTNTNKMSSNEYGNAEPDIKKKYDEMFKLLKSDKNSDDDLLTCFGTNVNSVKSSRNDINHFGQRYNPDSPDCLRSKLNKSYGSTMKLMIKIDEEKK